MASDDIARIRRNWAKAAAAGDIVGVLFYHRLFEIAPETRSLFATDLDAQVGKLMQTLNWIVDNVAVPEALMPKASALAVRHVRYGVTPGQYPLVGQALVETLAGALGADFSEADAAAWHRVYGSLSEAMIAAAYP
jgi:nitric oxide dioxygenase